MTESDWLKCSDPDAMLEVLRGKASERKLRLYLCSLGNFVPMHGRLQRSLEAHEAFADGEARQDQLDLLQEEEAFLASAPYEISNHDLMGMLTNTYVRDFRNALAAMFEAHDEEQESLKPTDFLRDIFGNPFRPVTLPPHILTWNDATIPHLAKAIYDNRELPSGQFDNAQMAILADALVDAGCSEQEVIDHCRSGGVHVRGCWMVDLLLGKE